MRKIYKFLATLALILSVFSVRSQCDIEVTMASGAQGWGDNTTWELQNGNGDVVLSGGTYGSSYNDVQTHTAVIPPYTLVINVNANIWCDNDGTYLVTVGGVTDLSGDQVSIECGGTLNLPLNTDLSACAPSCLPVGGVAASNLGLTTADLSWTSGAANFNIEWSTAPFTPGNNEEEGSATSATNSYSFSGLTQGTTYYVSVQADCGVDGVSTWSTIIQFTTPIPGATCEVALPIASLPFSATDNTSGYGDNYGGSPGASGCGTTGLYLGGDDVVYSFTADFDGVVNLSMTPTATWSGVFVYESCANIGVACYAGEANSGTGIRTFDFNVIDGNTYYIVISTNPTPQSTAYTLTLTQITCPDPTGLTLDNLTATTADVSWTPGGTEASWSIEWGAPGFTPGNSEEIDADISASPSYQITGLTADTDYEVYIQADCDTDGTSEWAGPFSIYTGYCVPIYTSTSDYTSSFVTIDAISNVSYSASSQPAGGYEDLSAGSPIVSQTDSTFNFTTAYVGGSNTFRIWVDWNNDFIFDDAEEVYLNSVSGATQSGSITIPNGTVSGDYRMRIRSRFSTTVPGACSSESFGSALDYTLRIIDPLVAPSLTQAGGTPDCATGTDLDATGTPDADIEWYWQAGADGTDMSNQYSGPYTVFANGTYYLRAYHTVYDFWSAASSIDVTNLPLAPTPPAPTAAQNPVCVPGTDISMPVPPADVTYYWQTVVDGVSTDSPADTPWNITETGTYYVAAFESTSGCWSPTSEITVTVQTEIPGLPTLVQNPYNFCSSAADMTIEANLPVLMESLTCTETATASGSDNSNTTAQITSFPCATGTITAVSLDASIGTWCQDWYSYDIVVNGSTVAANQCNQTGFDLTPYLPLTSVAIVSNDEDDWGDNVTLNLTVNITYDSPVAPQPSYTLTWYDDPNGQNEIGNGLSIDALGTSAIPTATNGQYQVYVAANLGACQGDLAMTTVNVNSVSANLSPIDVTCNGGNNGSFDVLSIECGVEPFTYSVNGGAFGPIPADLTAGTYSIVVRDANNDESAPYTVVIGQPETVSDVVADAISFEEVELSWNTVGSESQWVVEYGEAGFTPGTGTTVTVSANPATVDGLSENTTYDFYVAPLCAEGFEGEQDGPATATTFCVPIVANGWCESFDSDSETQDCWTVGNENADGDTWNMDYENNPNNGDQVAAIYTDINAGNNDDWLITPQLTLTGTEILKFSYRVQSSGEPNDFRVLLSTTGRNPEHFTETLMDLASYNNTTYEDTLVDLSAYTGNVFIAFHVPPGGLDGWRLYIDDVCINVCTPQPSQDGELDVCSLDETIDLNTIITPGETTGTWSFDVNPSALNGSTLTVDALPAGTYQAMYTVQTFCPEEADTAYATINLYGRSSAGNNSSVATCNYGSFNLFDGLTGSVDLGGTWYDPSNTALPGALVTFNGQIAANYNYYYVVSNGVCPEDTAYVEIQLQDCASIAENELAGFALYPNPTSDVVNIQYSGAAINTEVILSDSKGSVILNEKVNFKTEDNYEIDMTNLVKGVYFLNIYSESGSKVIRVVRN